MTLALILDTETTGLYEPDVIQLACKGPLQFGGGWGLAASTLEHFRPRKPIEPAAMATHRIILSDLESSPTWTGSWDVPQDARYLIGHGIDFDWKVIGSPTIRRICTLAIARFMWPDLQSHKLTALMYHLFVADAAREMTTNAHVASVDITLTEILLDHLLAEINEGPEKLVTSWETLWLFSENARIPLRLDFGKHGPQPDKGQPLGLLYTEAPRSYLHWMCDQADMDPWKLLAAKRVLGRE